jgi:cyclopropane-fatty-acyl-phospholipid synthase
MDVASVAIRAIGDGAPIRVTAYDGSAAGPSDAAAVLVVRSPHALARLLRHPGELGFARAYVAGDIEIEGDLYSLLGWAEHLSPPLKDPTWVLEMVKAAGPHLRRMPPPPAEEIRPKGLRHTRSRDAAAISHHYDVSNDFYRLVLGPSMTYSCAVFASPNTSLKDAQAAKHELICTKLGLERGQRLLDVGCGWGSLLLHAGAHHGATGVGITISREQADLAKSRVVEAELDGQLEIRLQDYRDVMDGPFDAISSVGMFEHVGRARFATYAHRLHDLLAPGGRLLNHAISRPGKTYEDNLVGRTRATARRVTWAVGSSRGTKTVSPFMQRYVFPDGELQEVGSVVSLLQEEGFEVRHVESLREHYALTLRSWVRNLEANWDEALAYVSPGRARVWRLYMAVSALGFETNHLAVHQVLAVKPDKGRSALPLRPAY